jgi:hypothetical protein
MITASPLLSSQAGPVTKQAFTKIRGFQAIPTWRILGAPACQNRHHDFPGFLHQEHRTPASLLHLQRGWPANPKYPYFFYKEKNSSFSF